MNRLILFIGVCFAVLKPLDVGAGEDWRQEKDRMDALSVADPDEAIAMGLQLSKQASDGKAWAWAAEFAASAGDILLQANQLLDLKLQLRAFS